MAQQPQQVQAQQPPVSDPDNVSETICDGQFNLSGMGPLATLTFTQVRPDAAQMFANGTYVPKAIVRARIVLTWQNLISLRDFLSANVKDVAPPESPAPATGGTTKH
jgi:hypothetical protein